MRKLVALPFGLIFVLLLLAAVTTFSLRTFAFDPQFYTSVLKQQGVFQDFERDPLKYVDLTSQFSQLEAVSPDTQRQIIRAALPQGWLEQTVTNGLRDFFDWLASDAAPPPRISIDLLSIKNRLQGSPGDAIAQNVVATVPTCAAGQQPQLSFDRLPECWPADLDRTLIVDQVAQVLDSAAAGLPNTIDIGPQLMRGGSSTLMVEGHRLARVPMVDVGLFVLVALTLLVWLIGALIGGRNSKERLMWLGGWLLFGALVAVGVYGLIFIGGARTMLSAPVVTLPEGFTSATTSVVQSVAAVFLEQLVWRAIIPTAVLLLAAVALIAAGMMRRRI